MRTFVKYAAFIVLIFCFGGCFCRKKSEWLINIKNSSINDVEFEVFKVENCLKKSLFKTDVIEGKETSLPLETSYGKYILVLRDKRVNVKVFFPEKYQKKAPITIRFLRRSMDK